MNNQQISRNKFSRYLTGGGASLMLIGFFLLPWATNSLSGTLGGGQNVTGIQMLWGELFAPSILRQVDIVKFTAGPGLLAIPVVSILVLAALFILDRFHAWRRAYWLIVAVAALVSAYPLVRLLFHDSAWVLLVDGAFLYYPRGSGIGFFATLIGILGLLAGAVIGMLGKDDSHLGIESKVSQAIEQKI